MSVRTAWEVFKTAIKKGWEFGNKHATATAVGYEAHQLIDNIGQEKAVVAVQQPIYRPAPPVVATDDGFGATDIMIILLSIIICLLLIILLVFGGVKLISFIVEKAAQRAVQSVQDEEEAKNDIWTVSILWIFVFNFWVSGLSVIQVSLTLWRTRHISIVRCMFFSSQYFKSHYSGDHILLIASLVDHI